MKSKTIYILLTQYPGWHSKAIQLWTGFPYTHVSVGLEEDMDTFYSFVYKGFIIESIRRYNKPGRKPFPCALYALDVSDATYTQVRQSLNSFAQNRENLHYNQLGVVLGLILRIPVRQKNRYFCSFFVAEILKRCNALHMRKNSALCFPKDFSRNGDLRMVFLGDLLKMAHRYKAA